MEPKIKNVEVVIENEWLRQPIMEEKEEKQKGFFIMDFIKKLFKHKGAIFGIIIIFLFIFSAIFAGWLAPYDYDKPELSDMLKAPSEKHIFGTDEFGRDIFSRIVYGSRISLKVAFIAVVFSLVVGTVLGALAGYYGGTIDYIISSFTDIAYSFPTTLLAIAFIAILGPGLQSVIIAIALASWAGYCRVVRGQFLSLKNREFVDAARILGMSDARIIFKHILPNALAPVIVMATLELPKAIVIEASLSFLGLGTQPPLPSWGVVLDSGKGLIGQAPWISFFPGLMIMLVVLGFNLFGDALRDVLDPNS